MMESEEFKAIFLPLGRMMYAEAMRLLRSPAEAEDAVQDVYVRLWERRGEFGRIESPGAYAMTMLRRHCLNLITSATRTREFAGAAPLSESATVARSDLHDEIESRDRVDKVFGVIDTLPDNQRQVITLHDIEGRPNEEIGKLTGLSADNIRQLLSRARKAVRKHFIK